MIVGGGEAQASIEREARLRHIDDELAVRAVVELPPGMVAFERDFGIWTVEANGGTLL